MMPRQVKVLMVAPALPIVGGQTVQAARLIRAFSSEEQVVVDFQPINPTFLAPLQKLKYIRTVITSLKYIYDLLRKVPHYDIVHIFSASYYSFFLAPTPAVLISRLFQKKTVLNYRSGEARDHLTRWRSAIPIIRLFDLIVTPSNYLVDVFGEFGIRAVSIFNFVELNNFRFRERTPLSPVFLSNRNFESHYNVGCTLRAFKEIQERIPNASLIVAGDGPERDQLQALANDLDLKNLNFVGTVHPDEMPELYEGADVYLNSPTIDNMPNSVIEAFACGLPVVSTNAGGIPYIIENERTGLLVGINDHEALAAAAVRLFEEQGLAKRLAENARSEVERYSWPSVRESWLKTYEHLAGGEAGLKIH